MSGNSKNNKVAYNFLENENDLEDFLYNQNGWGIVYINLVKTVNFHVKSLSDEARKMCKPGTNVGGSSQISEAFSYELFARWGFTELEKVSREWPCVYCNVFSWVICLKINLLLKFLLFSTPSESLIRDRGKIFSMNEGIPFTLNRFLVIDITRNSTL